jgi:hypothetical protein
MFQEIWIGKALKDFIAKNKLGEAFVSGESIYLGKDFRGREIRLDFTKSYGSKTPVKLEGYNCASFKFNLNEIDEAANYFGFMKALCDDLKSGGEFTTRVNNVVAKSQEVEDMKFETEEEAKKAFDAIKVDGF